jgi:condensin complex subunit 2
VPAGGVAASSLSKEEVLGIYQNCIKMAAESKINAKNSFNLRLIEHMEDLVKADDENETNFQKASCTLDAGVQIYSYRVDAVHTDAFKTLQGLNRTAVQSTEGTCLLPPLVSHR